MRSDRAVVDYWLRHYVRHGICVLCGNSGLLDTRGVKTPTGVACGGLHYCICPNGQAQRPELPLLVDVQYK